MITFVMQKLSRMLQLSGAHLITIIQCVDTVAIDTIRYSNHGNYHSHVLLMGQYWDVFLMPQLYSYCTDALLKGHITSWH